MDKHTSKTRWIWILITPVIAALVFLSVHTAVLPDQIEIFENETKVIDLGFPFSVQIDETEPVLQQTDGLEKSGGSFNLTPRQAGESSVTVSLLDTIPLKEISVKVLPKATLIPGGESIGVRMDIKGVVIVGLEEIPVSGGVSVNPGLEAGLDIGDVILAIDGKEIENSQQVRDMLNDGGRHRAVSLKIKRSDKTKEIQVEPVLSADENQYRLGLWVRDKTAGIGTLTYYNPQDQSFGALGHAITDPDTGVLVDVGQGEILHSRIVSIKQGASGSPGEVRGVFYETENPMGSLYANTEKGVFGRAYSEMTQTLSKEPCEIGYQNEVKKGKASIFTSIDEGEVKEYEIQIEKVNRQLTPGTKGMVIQVTDERLLEKTGGIVQGMSGSPIMQEGKIIGAVTHVFVNDPTRGYGIFIEWMLKQAKERE